MSDSGTFQILHLESKPERAASFEQAIAHAHAQAQAHAPPHAEPGMNGLVHTVTTREAFQSALGSPSLRLIVADDAVPGFAGLDALALARKQRPELPLVFVSDTRSPADGRRPPPEGADETIRREELWRLGPLVQDLLRQVDSRGARRGIAPSPRHSSASEILVEMVAHLARSTTLEEIGAIIAEAAHALTGADAAAFIHRDGDHCHYVDETPARPLFKGHRFPLETCIAGWCIRHRQQVVIADISVDPRVRQEEYERTFVRSLALAPVGKEEAVAALGIYWARPYAATVEDMHRLQLLGDSVAMAIENATRHREQRARAQRLQAQGRGLIRVARSPLAGRGDVESIYKLVTEQATQVLGVDGASVWLLDPSRERLVCHDLCAAPTLEHSALDLVFERSAFPEYFARLEEEQYIVIEPVSEDSLTATVAKAFFEPKGVCTALAVRIQHENAFLGLLGLYFSTPHTWRDDEVRFTLALANQLEITWATALRIRAERQLAEVNVHLDQLVRARTAELEIANRELDAFAKTLSHDLKSPVAVIESSAWLLRDQCDSQLEAIGDQALRRIESATKRMRHQIDAVLRLYHLSQEELVREPCDVTAIAKSAWKELQLAGVAHPANVTVTIQEGLVDQASPELLRSLLENLLSNALKYSSKREAPRIAFGAEPPEDANGVTRYHVRDNGVGFDMAQAGNLFGLFRRLHSASQFAGHGVGLASVQRIVQNHGGKIWAESAPDAGATFYFTLHSDP